MTAVAHQVKLPGGAVTSSGQGDEGKEECVNSATRYKPLYGNQVNLLDESMFEPNTCILITLMELAVRSLEIILLQLIRVLHKVIRKICDLNKRQILKPEYEIFLSDFGPIYKSANV